VVKQLSSGIVVNETDNRLSQAPGSLKFADVRNMRKDPTIFLARLMVRSPIIASAWTIERDDESLQSIADWVYAQLAPLRFRFLEAASQGLIDFGWQAFEKVWEVKDGLFVIKKLKPLLQDITDIKVDIKTGDFIGFINGTDDDEQELDLFDSLLLNINTECDYHYGQSYMSNAKKPYDASVTIMRSADIYDKKVAGAHWVIRFPDGGSSLYEGVETPNEVIAKNLLNALESSGSFAIPHKILDTIEQLSGSSPQAWQIELIESSGSGANFEERLLRCDREKVRAFGVPERSILEGQFGTKAEADSHADFALLGIDLMNQSIVEQLNVQLVNQILRVNYGDEMQNRVYLKAQPLSDTSISYMRSVYSTILSSPDGFITELAQLDIDAIRDRLQIPYVEVNDGLGS
jgi:hypothetical protein